MSLVNLMQTDKRKRFNPEPNSAPDIDDARKVATNAVRHILSDTDPNEQINRNRASARHFSRFFQQTLISVALIFAVAVSPALREAIVRQYNGYPAGSTHLAALMGEFALKIAPFLFVAVYAAYFVGLRWYWWRRREQWKEARLESGQTSPDSPPRGYLSTFLIYTQTKNTALYTRLFGVAMIYSALLGMYFALSESTPGIDYLRLLALLGLPAIEICFAAAIIFVGFGIGRDFVPGPILVKSTIVMGFRASTSQTDYTVAQNYAQPLLEDLRDERPWSFYSFRHKRRNDTR